MKATKGIDMPKKPGDAGYDLHADHETYILPGEHEAFDTAAIEIPFGYCGLIIGRSSLNKVGVLTVFGLIDSGYRGKIAVMLHNTGKNYYKVNKDERIAQLVIVPFIFPGIHYVEPDGISPSFRGETGFGSTGR